MKERPILFSAPMVRAILDGRKTQTRRIMKFAANVDAPAVARFHFGKYAGYGRTGAWVPLNKLGGIATKAFHDHHITCPYGQPGNRLWVRETWRVGAWDEDEGKIAVDYRADGYSRREWIDPAPDDDGETFTRLWEQSCEDCAADRVHTDGEGQYHWKPGESPCRWRPSIFMPRSASRITLEIKSVRVERLWEIKGKDVLAEGAVTRPHQDQHFGKMPVSAFDGKAYVDLLSLWIAGWNKINGKRAPWASNPWVWVIEFRNRMAACS